MLKTPSFKGANVFMSRKLVPPEIFDALHDELKLNGANVVLCCDPSRTGPDDYHVIASSDHEKFEDLRAKGCQLLGPQCVFSCANDHRSLPKQGYTCCLALDGVNVLASGFEEDEKVAVEIRKLVTSMGGVLHTKTSLDVSFVIAKNVLSAKYKWALHTVKKPILTINWLYQCCNEHRIVPQESFRVLPVYGLKICVTGIPSDERKEIEKLIIENGGQYSPELTKECTHLICDAPEGDKYMVARMWGRIHVVTRKWFYESIARRARLYEGSFPFQGGSISSKKNVKGCFASQNSQSNCSGNLQAVPPSVVADSNSMTCLGLLAGLWPNGFMDNHGIKSAICWEKDRRRERYSQNKDPEKMRRKKMLTPKVEESVRVEASSIPQQQYIRERLATEPGSHGSGNKPVSGTTAAVRIPSPINGPSFDRLKQERLKGSASNSPDDTSVGDGALIKKKVKRKPDQELDETRIRPEKLPSQQGEERQKSFKQAAGVPHKSNHQSTGLPSVEQSS